MENRQGKIKGCTAGGASSQDLVRNNPSCSLGKGAAKSIQLGVKVKRRPEHKSEQDVAFVDPKQEDDDLFFFDESGLHPVWSEDEEDEDEEKEDDISKSGAELVKTLETQISQLNKAMRVAEKQRKRAALFELDKLRQRRDSVQRVLNHAGVKLPWLKDRLEAMEGGDRRKKTETASEWFKRIRNQYWDQKLVTVVESLSRMLGREPGNIINLARDTDDKRAEKEKVLAKRKRFAKKAKAASGTAAEESRQMSAKIDAKHAAGD